MKVASSVIPFSSANAFSKLFLDYTGQKNKELEHFYSFYPDSESFAKAINSFPTGKHDRNTLVDVLLKQNTELFASNAKLEGQIVALKDENTFTVCTAHQPCLFTGPLYFIYKIVSAINLASALKKAMPEKNFVPVYWMGSEDHDFEEINHAYVFGKKMEWSRADTGGPVGRLPVASVSSLMKELTSLLGESDNAKNILKTLHEAYAPGVTLSVATRRLVNALFGEYGVVVIDGDDALLKKGFSAIMADDIFHQTNKPLVEESVEKLKALGYDAQVNPRDINVFYLSDDKRERIIAEGSTFKVQSGSKLEFTHDELKKELEQHFERFSPNVVLRPLYQQQVLPNIAYVGGPAEMAYWLELKKVFDHHKVYYPALVPRHSVLWTDAKQASQLKKLGFAQEDLFLSLDAMIKVFIEKNSTGVSFKEEEQQLRNVFGSLALKATHTDVTLKASVEAELQKALQSLKHIETKMTRAEKQKHETALGQVKKLKEKLFPEGKLQERHDNFISLYTRHGQALLPLLLERLEAYQQGFIILSEEG